MSIESQKALADKLLQKLSVVSPYVMLAGGAPRDWYFEKEAQDLDIYLYSPAITIKTFQKQLKDATGVSFKHNWELQKDDRSLYTSMPQLRRVFEAEVEGQKVQIMQLNNPLDEFKVVSHMSTSICKIWYINGKLEAHQDFKLTIASGSMFLNEGYQWSDPHPKKMIERFRGKFATTTREQAQNVLVNKALKGLNI